MELTINKSGNLSVQYFLSYLFLVSKSMNGSSSQIIEFTEKRMFGIDCGSRGEASYQNFLKACSQFLESEGCE
ncbi:hypothetical protein CEF21_07070 [Bacillus sp. FJAT-42376]|nr:hypothetical protein CEF21_07070 [Bacillus sp. FJAT-42376]